jgi:hypothetical protein
MARKRSETKVTGWVKLQDTVVEYLRNNDECRQLKSEEYAFREMSKGCVDHIVDMAVLHVVDISPTTTGENARKKAKAAVTTFLKG